MMAQHRQLSHNERAEIIEERIENVFAFVQDVLDEPSVLDDLQEQATIELTLIPNKDASQAYAVETRRFAVAVAQPGPTRRR